MNGMNSRNLTAIISSIILIPISILIPVLLLIWTTCASSYPVRSVGKSNLALDAIIGGPITKHLGAPVPIPNLYLGARYGVTKDVDVSGSINLFPLIMPGFLHSTTRLHWVPIQPGIRFQKASKDQGWALSTQVGLEWMTNFSDGVLCIPYFDFSAGYRYKWFNPFLGISFGVHAYRPFYIVRSLFLKPHAGIEFILNPKISLLWHVAFLDATTNNYMDKLSWIHIINAPDQHKKYGIFAMNISVSWRLTAPFIHLKTRIQKAKETRNANSNTERK